MMASSDNLILDQKYDRLSRAFFQRETRIVAKGLLGKILVSFLGGTVTAGRIVETEAYLAKRDSACHAAKHRTARTEMMFGPAGFAYVYPIHAKHCFNIVTEAVDYGCAVLIRALEPNLGIKEMRRRRGKQELRRLTTGPACICQALGIDRRINGLDLTSDSSSIWVADDGEFVTDGDTVNTVRIGVTSAQNRKLRYAVRSNPFVSGPLRLRQP